LIRQIVRRLVGRPVLFAFDLATLKHLGGHNDDQHLLFPDHAPEVGARVRQRALRGNERVLLFVTIDEIGMYVIGHRILVRLSQQHPGVIVAKHIRIPVLQKIGSSPAAKYDNGAEGQTMAR